MPQSWLPRLWHREAKFLWKLFGALNVPVGSDSGTDAVDLFTDSMGVVALSRNAVLSSATKHMEIADFYVRELVTRGIVTVAHVPTGSMLADVLTKPLAKIKFFGFINAILGMEQSDENCHFADPQWDVGKDGQVQHDRDGHYCTVADKDVAGISGRRGRRQNQSAAKWTTASEETCSN